MAEEKRNIRIVDIARLAGVSSGTVDRVLHNRGKVSADKKERIDKVLKEINYKPNIIARSLAMKKHYTIAVLIPLCEKGSYWDGLSKGIEKASSELQSFNIDIEYIYFDQYNIESFKKNVDKLLEHNYSAVLIAPLFKVPSIDLSLKLEELEIPYAYIDSNILEQNNLAYFGADSFNSGILAAKLLLYEMDLDSDIILAKIASRNDDDSTQTNAREKGFLKYLDSVNYQGRIHRVRMRLDSCNDDSLKDISDIVKTNNIRGGIMFNSRIYELAELLFHNLKVNKDMVKLIGYDLIEKNVEALKNNEVSFLLSQRSDMQGYNGVKALSNFLLFQEKTNQVNYMPIDILVKENIDYYKNVNL